MALRVRAILVSVLVGALLRPEELLHLLHHFGVVNQIHVLRLEVRRKHIATERVRGRASSDVTRVTGAGGIGHLGE